MRKDVKLTRRGIVNDQDSKSRKIVKIKVLQYLFHINICLFDLKSTYNKIRSDLKKEKKSMIADQQIIIFYLKKFEFSLNQGI